MTQDADVVKFMTDMKFDSKDLHMVNNYFETRRFLGAKMRPLAPISLVSLVYCARAQGVVIKNGKNIKT